jgi:DNA polymerase I-like protein with 3'-5' exonuclease and polymerase domains
MSQLALFTPTSEWVPPKILPDLRGERLVAVDIETKDVGISKGVGPGWVWMDGFITGIAVAWGEDNQVYIPVRHPDSECFDGNAVKGWLKDLFAQDNTRFVFHNAGYDMGWIDTQFSTGWPKHVEDTAALAAMCDENRFSYKLDDLCVDYGLPGKDETLLKEAVAAFGLRDPKGDLWRLPAKFVAPYAQQDARSTLGLFKRLWEICEREKTQNAYRVECDLLPMIYQMRKRGIRVDVGKAEQAVIHFAEERDRVLEELSRNLGRSATMEAIRSPAWLIEAFTREGISFPKTAKGNASFEASWMAQSEHWLPKLITRAKKLEDASSKFFQNYILDFQRKGRVHPNINQFRSEGGGTRSHRFSYSAPPLQQAPSRSGEFANVFRGAFLPEDGEIWAACDYSQQEFRGIVHYAELINATKASEAGDAYRNDPKTDFHSLVSQLTGLPRKKAKDCNFGIAFSAGVQQIANMSGMSLEEAKQVLQQYNAQMPFIKELATMCSQKVERDGFIRLIDGAVCHFPFFECAEYGVRGIPALKDEAIANTQQPGHAWYGKRLRRAYTHKSLNRLIQGSAARQTKKAMLDCYNAGLLPLISVHDELGFSVKTREEAEHASQIMRDAIPLTIPCLTDLEYGRSWGDSMRGRDFDEVLAEIQKQD